MAISRRCWMCPLDGADPIIGDRAFSREPASDRGARRAPRLKGLHAGGVAGCIKHMPGHGRAEADSHLALPRVTASEKRTRSAMSPRSPRWPTREAAMTAHIVYEALGSPIARRHARPHVIDEIIRGRDRLSGPADER